MRRGMGTVFVGLVGLAVLVAIPVRADSRSATAGAGGGAAAVDTAVAATRSETATPSSVVPAPSADSRAVADTASATETAVVPEVLTINEASPGEPFDLKPHIVPGQINIVDFYSAFCPPCVRIAPYLERLAEARPDIVLRKVDINRKGFRGIDWGSPLSRQYRLQSVPHFKIFGPDGALLSEGDPAMAQIQAWLRGE